jgi:hypothetical protein
MDIVGMIKSGLDAFIGVFNWKTGGRTKEENALRKDANYWNAEYKDALAKGDVARSGRARAELRKLRDTARAKST